MKYWFIFVNDTVMLSKNTDGSYTIPLSEQPPIPLKPSTHVMEVAPMEDGTEVRAVSIVSPIVNDPRFEAFPLRKSFYHLSTELYLKAGKCRELLYWDRNTQYCGACGAPMRMDTIISKKCTQCGKEIWPQLATAVIVLIHRGEEVLLVHARNFANRRIYGLVAGFVETGETLEEAVRREVMEETSLTITNFRYFGSQPWPFPCGLMVGFHADYEGGEIHLQRSELERGNWFDKEHLPPLPEKLSIARKLVDDWLGEV